MSNLINDIAIDKTDWRNLVTPKYTKNRPIYDWFIYPHSYDKILVEQIISIFQLKSGDVVWDPFLGAGTSVITCLENGISAVGSDLLPLSIIVTQAKISTYDIEELRSNYSTINFSISKNATDRFADIPIVKKALFEDTRLLFSSILAQIESLPEKNQPFFITALLSVLEKVSMTRKSGGWLKIEPNNIVSVESAKEIICKRIEKMICDVSSSKERNQIFKTIRPHDVWIGDARFSRPDSLVNAIITSPPYLNRHDYTRVFALELSLAGIANSSELKDLRYCTLRSHVEAKKQADQDKPLLDNYKEPELIRSLLCEMAKNGKVDSRVEKMIIGYFEDMYLVLDNNYKALKPDGFAAYVIGDVRFYGVMIPVTEIICQLGIMVGFFPEKVYIARYRGNSAQQMASYGREKSMESVIIFRKTR